MLEFKTIEDFDLNGKKVIIRVDFNVPVKDGKITDDNRIVKSIKTIKYALDNGAKEVILMSHMGKVKKEEDKVSNDLRIVVPRLESLLNMSVDFLEHTSGNELLNDLANSKNCVKLMQNTRYEDLNNKRESNNDENLGRFWASLADVAIFDAFGASHRNHASTSSMFKHINCGVGFLVNEEISKIEEIINDNSHPFVIVMGGAKVSDKISVINNLIDKCDRLIIGGAMSFTFLKALGYNVGKSLVDDNHIEFCRNLMEKYASKISLPFDVVTNNGIKTINNILDDEMGLDIGPETVKVFEENLKTASRVIANGTMGKNEDSKYALGSKEIYTFLANSNAKVLVGGGDTASFVNDIGLSDKFYHISTGGGATLEYLGGNLGSIFEILNSSSVTYGKNKKRNKEINN